MADRNKSLHRQGCLPNKAEALSTHIYMYDLSRFLNRACRSAAKGAWAVWPPAGIKRRIQAGGITPFKIATWFRFDRPKIDCPAEKA